MKINRWIELSKRLYGRLLRLYPQAYRATYETEMFHLFRDQCREAYEQKGILGILSLWARTFVDVGASVVREHLSDPQARVGLLDAPPNAPLPWKGVLLVLIPGLIFFVSQIAQLTSDKDWFFLVLYRAGYFLILPVLLVWLLTRRFPVWGLIPLGLLYETLWSYSQRVQLSELPIVGDWFTGETVIFFDTRINVYTVKYLLATVVCMILFVVLIRYNLRRRQISQTAWKWLGLFGLLLLLQIVGEAYRLTITQAQYGYWTSAEVKEYLLQLPLWYIYDSLPFLLLVFTGMLFAPKYRGFSFLLLLGYLLPTVIFGRYGVWNEAVPFYVVSLAVLIYRFIVALVAPVWLVRAASIPGQQRAASIPVVIAILSHIILSILAILAASSQTGYQPGLMDSALYIWKQLIIAAGLGLAVVLYLPRDRDQARLSPPALAEATQ